MKVDLNEGLKRVRYLIYGAILVIAALITADGWESNKYRLFLETSSPTDGWRLTTRECDYKAFSELENLAALNRVNVFDKYTGDLYDISGNRSIPENLRNVIGDIETCYRANKDGFVPLTDAQDPYKDFSEPIYDAASLVRYVKTRDSKIEISAAETKKIRDIATPIVMSAHLQSIRMALFWSSLIIVIIEATSWVIGWVVKGFIKQAD